MRGGGRYLSHICQTLREGFTFDSVRNEATAMRSLELGSSSAEGGRFPGMKGFEPSIIL